MTRNILLYWSSPRTRNTSNRAFSSGVVTICFNDLGLSRPGFEHSIFCVRGEPSKRPRNAVAQLFMSSSMLQTYYEFYLKINKYICIILDWHISYISMPYVKSKYMYCVYHITSYQL